MYRTMLLGLALSVPASALACGGNKRMAAADAEAATQVAAVDPTHCAKQADLVGSNCSYSTGMMAQRVLEQGKPFSFTGLLANSDNALGSRVAAPYTVGPDSAHHVVANEVVESLVKTGAVSSRLTLAGKVLEVDGVSYFVATTYEAMNT